jgi:hypothetical protein
MRHAPPRIALAEQNKHQAMGIIARLRSNPGWSPGHFAAHR